MIVCPCKDCANRSISCHSTCVEYNEWLKQHVDMMKKLKRDRDNVIHPGDFLSTSPPPGKHIEKRKKRYGRK